MKNDIKVTVHNRNEFLNQLHFRDKLIDYNKYNSGDKTVILASSSTWDGWCFSIWEHMYGKHVSQYIKNSSKIHQLFSMNPKNISIKLQATSNDLFNVLHDRTVENIILVWHASYNSWASRSWIVDSFDISKKANDHLKKWFFINAWCALVDSNAFFPLWAFCVKDRNKLAWAKMWRKIWFKEIKQHKFYSHPVFIHEYLTYYSLMWDDIYDIREYEYLLMKNESKNK